jgi:hypothetical protein
VTHALRTAGAAGVPIDSVLSSAASTPLNRVGQSVILIVGMSKTSVIKRSDRTNILEPDPWPDSP